MTWVESVCRTPIRLSEVIIPYMSRYKVDRAIAVIWKMLMVAESRFRKLKAPELMKDVHLGVLHKDGIVIEPMPHKVAALSRLHTY